MDDRFQWLTQEAPMPALDFDLIARWIDAVARLHNRIVGNLSYIFCNDERILEVNRQYLNHDYFTDIITFDYCRGRLLRGDLFISLDTVASNAVSQGATYADELNRVIIHGVLHLCGINDKGPGEREIMEANENEALDLLKQL
jgi:rRNA maturation RNase YbeY